MRGATLSHEDGLRLRNNVAVASTRSNPKTSMLSAADSLAKTACAVVTTRPCTRVVFRITRKGEANEGVLVDPMRCGTSKELLSICP